MSPAAILILAVGMSADAFVAALGRGASAKRASLIDALRTGTVFGMVEAITPLIGWIAGVTASGVIAAFDHWVAFALLALVGGRMLSEALRLEESAPPRSGSFAVLLVTAVGTSIDAMAVGVSLAFLDVDIIVIAAAIGVATFCMAMAGIVLIGLGCSIRFEHITA